MGTQSQRIIKNSVISTAGYTSGAALNFIMIILIARYFGKEDFGYYSFVISFVSTFQLIADLGTRNILIRDVAIDSSNLSYRFGLSKSIAWVLSGIAYLCILIFINIINVPEKVVYSTHIAGIATLVTFHSVLYGAICRAFEETVSDVAGFILHKIAFLSILLVGFRYKIGFSDLFYVMLIANTSQLLYYYYIVRYRHGRLKLVFNISAGWELFKESVPLGISEVFRKIMWQAGTVLLTLISTAAATGIFSASYKIIQAIQILSGALAIPFFPAISRLGNKPDKLVIAIERTFKFMAIFTFPIAISVFVFSGNIVRLFYGNTYNEAIIVLSILSAIILFVFPNAMFPFVFTSLNKQRLYSICSFVSLCTNILFNFVLISIYSYKGAALGALIGEVFLFFASMYFLRKELGAVKIIRYIWKPFLVSLIIGCALFFLKDSSLIILAGFVIAGGLIYIIMLYILRILTQDEFNLLLSGLKIKKISQPL